MTTPNTMPKKMPSSRRTAGPHPSPVAQIVTATKSARQERVVYACLFAGVVAFCFAVYHAPAATAYSTGGLGLLAWIGRIFGR